MAVYIVEEPWQSFCMGTHLLLISYDVPWFFCSRCAVPSSWQATLPCRLCVALPLTFVSNGVRVAGAAGP